MTQEKTSRVRRDKAISKICLAKETKAMSKSFEKRANWCRYNARGVNSERLGFAFIQQNIWVQWAVNSAYPSPAQQAEISDHLPAL